MSPEFAQHSAPNTPCNLSHQLPRQHQFVGVRQFLAAVGVHQKQGVVVLPKSGWANVAHQQRHAFAGKFGLGVMEQIMALGRKAHTEQSARLGAF